MSITITSFSSTIDEGIQFPDAIKIKSFSSTIDLNRWFDNKTEYEVVQPSTKLFIFADSVANDELSPNELNINPNNSLRVQAVIDDGLTALSLTTGQKVFTIQELIALAGATFTGFYDITLYFLDANTLQYIKFTFVDEETANMGTIENVT